MKKLISMLLVLVMVVSVFAACNKTENTAGGDAPASSLEVLQNVWNKYADDQKFFVMGGDIENPVSDGPGEISADKLADLPYTLYIPEAELANIDGAATMMHAMLANNFTSGVVHLKSGVDAKAFGATMKDALANNQWMCGFPDEMVIATVGEYVVIAFGATDLMSVFKTNLTAAYANAEVLYHEGLL